MLGRAIFTGSLLFAAQAFAQFNLYPTVDADRLAKAFGVGIDCLTALNETVSCDQTLFQMASSVDDYAWQEDDVTALCTSDCQASAKKWWDDVSDKCSDDKLNAYGKMVPADTIAGRFVDGLNIACLRPDTDLTKDPGLNGTIVNSTDFQQVASIQVDPTFNETDDSSNSTAIQRRQATTSAVTNATDAAPANSSSSSGSSWCVIESLSWVGSDIIRADCHEDSDNIVNGTDPCSDDNVDPENERIANLYPDDLLCSDCFVKMFYLRLASPFLPDTHYSDYLLGQYNDIINVCKKEMPELTIRDVPYYDNAPGTYDGLPVTTSNTTDASNGTTSIGSNSTVPVGNGTVATDACTGRTVQLSSLANMTMLGNGTMCDSISTYLNASSADLMHAFGDPNCSPSSDSICVAQPCTLMQVPTNSTCDSMVKLISSSSGTNITAMQFLNWNAQINGLCSSLDAGQYVCISPPGGAYIVPPISNMTTTNAGAQARGGGGGEGNGSSSSDPGSSNSTTPTSKPDGPSATPSPSPTDSGPSPAAAAPSATQTGIVAKCDKYDQAKAGDTCSSLAQKNNIKADDLYAWNPVLGDGGKNCETQFWTNYYYCVGVSS